MTTTLSPPIRILGIVGILAAAAIGLLLFMHSRSSTSSAAPVTGGTLHSSTNTPDALWPLHPLGILADVERPDESGAAKDVNSPGEWRKQSRHNLETLREYRANWADSEEAFQDRDTIFRTPEGRRLYREWAGVWGL